jgi:hypothetical protein
MSRQRTMTIRTAVVLALFAAAPALAAAQTRGTSGGANGNPCSPGGQLTRMDGLREASGVAVGRTGTLWVHNDSGEPILFALDEKGTVTGRVRVTGANVEDWEAITSGPCATGTCLYVGDIGDNDARRRRITVYQVPEPAAGASSAAVSAVFHATYPDGAHDAEAMFIAGGRLHIVTKGEPGPMAVYRFPAQPQAGATARLERVGQPMADRVGPEERITDAAVSPDGATIALRTLSSLVFYRAADFVRGEWLAGQRVDLRPLGEAQGEGLALGPNGEVYLLGEGGGGNRPGTFVRFTCRVNS